MTNKSSRVNNQYAPIKSGNVYSRFMARNQETLPWFTSKVMLAMFTIIFSATDALVLSTVVNKVFTESFAMVLLTSVTVALLLNTLPLLAIYCAKQALYKTSRFSGVIAAVITVTLIIAFCITFALRWSNRDMYATADLQNNMAVIQVDEAVVQAEEEEDPAVVVAVVFTALIPAFTSVMNGGIYWISEDPVRNKVQILRKNLIQANQHLADVRAGIHTMPTSKDIEYMLENEEVLYEHAEDAVKVRVYAMHAEAIKALAEAVRDSNSTSMLVQKCLDSLHSDLAADKADPAPRQNPNEPQYLLNSRPA